MTRWKVKTWVNGQLLRLASMYDSLDDALDAAILLGTGTRKKFRIYKVEINESFYDSFTAKQAMERRAKNDRVEGRKAN